MFIWFSTMTLMVEATRVIELRLRLIAIGRSTADEILLMVTEKIDALEQAKSVIIRGGDPSLIIDNYRKIVAANVARLSGTGGLGIVGREAIPVVIIPASVLGPEARPAERVAASLVRQSLLPLFSAGGEVAILKC